MRSASSRALNPRLNAFITVTADDGAARARARRIRKSPAAATADRCTAFRSRSRTSSTSPGVPTTAASRLREGRRSPSVTRRSSRNLREAGAVFVGKTNLHEFAFGTTSEDSALGPARHPVDDTRSPGGSSGGSAIAVRTGMSIASVGTDTGGSIRIPAAACGIVGLKPGWGEISADGVVPLSRQLDHVGPLARSVADAAIMFDVLRGAFLQRVSVMNASLRRRRQARGAWRVLHGPARRRSRSRRSCGHRHAAPGRH